MRKETWSIGFACALGAFIGTLVALEIAARFTYGSWFWGVGALIGGLVAYCAVDFRHFCAGIASSYRKTIDWRPHREWWGTYFACVGLVAMTYTSVVIVTLVILAPITEDHLSLNTVLMSLALVGTMSFFIGIIEVPFICNDTVEAFNQRLLVKRKYALRNIFHVSPIGILYMIAMKALGVSKSLWENKLVIVSSVVAATCFVARKTKQFVIGTFLYVHSERRKICFVDATLGATAGYFLGSAIVGALVGAILGIINYEIVSIRWLKIVPAKATTK